MPLAVLAALREEASNFVGLKVSDTPWERFEPYLLEGLDIFVGPEALIPQGLERGAAGAVSGLAASFPDAVVALVREPTAENGARVGALRAALQALPFHAASKMVLGMRGVPVRGRVRPPLRGLRDDEIDEVRAHRERMGRIVVAGSGAIGASIAYHLALLGADDVVVAERGELAGGSTARAMGGVRQQFSTPEEVVLARESIEFLAALGPQFFRQVGYLFLATTEAGLAELEERRALQNSLGVPVERVDASVVPGLAVGDVLGATCCWSDGVADPRGRRA